MKYLGCLSVFGKSGTIARIETVGVNVVASLEKQGLGSGRCQGCFNLSGFVSIHHQKQIPNILFLGLMLLVYIDMKYWHSLYILAYNTKTYSFSRQTDILSGFNFIKTKLTCKAYAALATGCQIQRNCAIP